jgi:DNA (cytosine-5)-methyltransferase 1
MSATAAIGSGSATSLRRLTIAGLFAGIGGIELGMHRAGHETRILSEISDSAARVLQREFSGIELNRDVLALRRLPEVDVVAAGFPCQDISLAGTREGLAGSRSGLVSEVFRLIEPSRPEFILLENVQNLLRLSRGETMRVLISEIERLGYQWAYRLVDSRGFGLPQRRQRVIILASRGDVDPASVLFRRTIEPLEADRINEMEPGHAYGFYWTEGKRGVGWAKNAVPTIKGGSGLGIPSPPAVFDFDSGTAGTPTIEDAERLQGFRAGFTRLPGRSIPRRGDLGERWKMVGNAVSVPVAEWIGRELARPHREAKVSVGPELRVGQPWPRAALGLPSGERHAVGVSTHVRVAEHSRITDFLKYELKPLSQRALEGYVSRARSGTKQFPRGFIDALERQARESTN